MADTNRRMYVVANHVVGENIAKPPEPEQLNLFTDYTALEQQQAEQEAREKEKRRQKAVLTIQKNSERTLC